jgi:hypothetical protein
LVYLESRARQRFQALRDGLVQPITAREFYRRLLPVVASLRHGHTGLSLPVQGVGYRLRHLEKGRTYFPGEVRFLNGRLYVVADLSEKLELGNGAEIVAIDGRPGTALLDQMRLYLSADGSNDTFKPYQLGNGFRFHALLDLLFGSSETYSVDLVPSSGGAQTRRDIVAIAPERMASLYRERVGRELDSFPSPLHFELLPDDTALLTISSFYEGLIKKGEPSFADFFEATFREIKERRVQDLVIDVRGNEGGNSDYPVLLYTYLADKPFELAKPTILASASMSFFRYAPHSSDDVKSLRGRSTGFRRASAGRLLGAERAARRGAIPHLRSSAGRLHRPPSHPDRRRLLFRDEQFPGSRPPLSPARGRHVSFVGEQNGGDNTFGKSSGGQALAIVLPHSKLSLSIPLLGASEHFATAEPKR